MNYMKNVILSLPFSSPPISNALLKTIRLSLEQFSYQMITSLTCSYSHPDVKYQVPSMSHMIQISLLAVTPTTCTSGALQQQVSPQSKQISITHHQHQKMLIFRL